MINLAVIRMVMASVRFFIQRCDIFEYKPTTKANIVVVVVCLFIRDNVQRTLIFQTDVLYQS